MDLSLVYFWSTALVSTFIALNTVWKIVVERDRLGKENLNDEDRAFVWRIVVFICFPFFCFVDLRATLIACQMLGIEVSKWSYGLIWYQVEPVIAGIQGATLVAALFSGEVVACSLALLCLVALSFRPHPFLATLIGYSAAFALGVNLIVDPLLSLAGLDSGRWQVAFSSLGPKQFSILVTTHVVLGVIYVFAVRNRWSRLWFSDLTRPTVCEELKKALANEESAIDARALCHIGLLYDRAGLKRPASRMLKRLKDMAPESPYTYFLQAVLAYRARKYKEARLAFVQTSDLPLVEETLKGQLLAAGACAAFAQGDLINALNLSDRALEFDQGSLVARMVKVDVFLKQGRKEQAAEEILLAMHMGPTLELEDIVPIDTQEAFNQLALTERRHAVTRALQGLERG